MLEKQAQLKVYAEVPFIEESIYSELESKENHMLETYLTDIQFGESNLVTPVTRATDIEYEAEEFEVKFEFNMENEESKRGWWFDCFILEPYNDADGDYISLL